MSFILFPHNKMARRLLKMTSWAIFKTISFSSEIVKFSFLIFHLKKIGQKKEAVSKKEAVGDAKHFFFGLNLGFMSLKLVF